MWVLVVDELFKTVRYFSVGVARFCIKVVQRRAVCGHGALNKHWSGCIPEGVSADILLNMLRICFLRFEFDWVVYDCRVRGGIVNELWLKLDRPLLSGCHWRQRWRGLPYARSTLLIRLWIDILKLYPAKFLYLHVVALAVRCQSHIDLLSGKFGWASHNMNIWWRRNHISLLFAGRMDVLYDAIFFNFHYCTGSSIINVINSRAVEFFCDYFLWESCRLIPGHEVFCSLILNHRANELSYDSFLRLVCHFNWALQVIHSRVFFFSSLYDYLATSRAILPLNPCLDFLKVFVWQRQDLCITD